MRTAVSACSGVSTPLKTTPIKPDVERLFHDPIGLVGLRREAREQRDVRLQIAFRLQRSLVRHAEQECREAREVERVVLHVGVREVDRSTRGLARVRERQVAGVDEPVDGLAGRELRDDGVQVHVGALRLREGRRRCRQGRERDADGYSHGGGS